MSRVVKFPVQSPQKLGPKRVRKKRRPDLEDYGQLNLFDASRVVNLPRPNDYFEVALALDEQDDPDAVQAYLKAIEANQYVADSYCNLGIIFSRNDELAKAVDFLTLCLKYDSRHFEAHYNLANIYSDLGNGSLAEFHFQMSIEIDNEFPNSYYNLGLLYISERRYDEAQNCINRYIDLSPETGHHATHELLKTLKTLAL